METMTSPAGRDLFLVPADSELLTHFLSRRAAPLKLSLFLGLVGVLIGIGANLAAPVRYSSAIDIWVGDAPITIRPFESTDYRLLTIDTEAQRAKSSEVLKRAGIGSLPDNLIESIEVTAPPVSKILRLSVISDSPEAAQSGADALGDAYLGVRDEFLVGRRDTLLASLRDKRARLTSEYVAAPNSAVADIWSQELAEIRTAERNARNSTVYPGRLSRAASRPTEVTESTAVAPASGFVLGSLAGYVVGLPLINRRKSSI